MANLQNVLDTTGKSAVAEVEIYGVIKYLFKDKGKELSGIGINIICLLKNVFGLPFLNRLELGRRTRGRLEIY